MNNQQITKIDSTTLHCIKSDLWNIQSLLEIISEVDSETIEPHHLSNSVKAANKMLLDAIMTLEEVSC